MFLFDTESHEFRECVCSCLLTRCKLSCTWFQQAVIFVYVMLWSVVHLFSHITFPSYLLVYNTFWDSFFILLSMCPWVRMWSVWVRVCVCACVRTCLKHHVEGVSSVITWPRSRSNVHQHLWSSESAWPKNTHTKNTNTDQKLLTGLKFANRCSSTQEGRQTDRRTYPTPSCNNVPDRLIRGHKRARTLLFYLATHYLYKYELQYNNDSGL